MVIAYYEPQLQDSWNREALIDILHHTMGTDENGGTGISNMALGIENLYEEYQRISNLIAFNNVVRNDYEAWIKSSSTGVYDAISDINNDYPLLLLMIGGGSALDRSQNYRNHAVTVVGYVGYSSSFYWEIHDTWDSADHYIFLLKASPFRAGRRSANTGSTRRQLLREKNWESPLPKNPLHEPPLVEWPEVVVALADADEEYRSSNGVAYA